MGGWHTAEATTKSGGPSPAERTEAQEVRRFRVPRPRCAREPRRRGTPVGMTIFLSSDGSPKEARSRIGNERSWISRNII